MRGQSNKLMPRFHHAILSLATLAPARPAQYNPAAAAPGMLPGGGEF
jgi:hypothetical protein